MSRIESLISDGGDGTGTSTVSLRTLSTNVIRNSATSSSQLFLHCYMHLMRSHWLMSLLLQYQTLGAKQGAIDISTRALDGSKKKLQFSLLSLFWSQSHWNGLFWHHAHILVILTPVTTHVPI
jgi:hypothetical protein